jgi:hypothetical protein
VRSLQGAALACLWLPKLVTAFLIG